MVLGIGIDILSLSRFQALINRRTAQTLAKRICTPQELSQLPKSDPIRFLSSRYALILFYLLIPFIAVSQYRIVRIPL